MYKFMFTVLSGTILIYRNCKMSEGTSTSDKPNYNEEVNSSYFSFIESEQNTTVVKEDYHIKLSPVSFASTFYYYECELVHNLIQNSSSIIFDPVVEYIYNPIDYAMDVHLKFLNTYCKGPKKLLYLGMNPGPWGMMQTGIPFGEVNIVRDWLKLNGTINAPVNQHPSRLVTGFNCHRSEISGKRFWEFAKQISNNNPFNFFRHSFIYNYLPLGLITKTGKNITPADFKASDQKSIHIACDQTLCKIIQLLQVDVIIAIGRFAEKRAKAALKLYDVSNVKVVFITHPSPRNVRSNKNWVENTITTLAGYNLLHYFT